MGTREPHEAKKKFSKKNSSVGIEPTTSGLDLPLLCQLSYEVGQRNSGPILGGDLRRRESKGTQFMNVVPRSTGTQMVKQRINSEVYIKVLIKLG